MNLDRYIEFLVNLKAIFGRNIIVVVDGDKKEVYVHGKECIENLSTKIKCEYCLVDPEISNDWYVAVLNNRNINRIKRKIRCKIITIDECGNVIKVEKSKRLCFWNRFRRFTLSETE